eukprot:CAMPEP_0179847520 /NCGR_PEP_ID=MMETSP0982-20121206/6126_1 /TAXON_ID=483367 /ORGANISM="non described non described, Strain CCMP 2436" /LENGTH=205 /DNA_ID=CAMNT_0021732709 /DNA_START=123 /DNA_END=740 /DNA_ORIENTATION=+
MAKKQCVARLRKECERLVKEPVPHIACAPLEDNILEWHFAISAPPATPFEGGCYHGKLVFPPEYPYRPPSISMLTPSGRFETNMRLCLSMSDFHPETWCPAWSVGTILNGILSFMLESTPTVGSVETTLAQKRNYARLSHAHNRKDAVFKQLFPQLVQTLSVAADGTPAEPEDELSSSRTLLGQPSLWLALWVAVVASCFMIAQL